MTKYNKWQNYFYKTGNALNDLYCKKCGEKIYNKGEKIRTSIFSGDKNCCCNCDAILHKRSNGGQGDSWGLVLKKML